MLQASNLSKIYGTRALFEGASFSLTSGDRVGLVGRNGSGKSTLFKLILGQEATDSGAITSPRGYRIGHLEQHLKFSEESVLKEACLGLQPEERELEYKAEIILDGLGFSEEDLLKPPSSFSGGFQIRINLAKLLLSEPNLLLLDEPTNYLDIISVRWLETFLRAWKGEMIIISHDRLFMDKVTTHSMLIHRGQIRKIAGDTEKLYSQVLQDEEIYERTRLNEDKKRQQLEVFINRFRAKASKATLVQSKIKALERMGRKEELQDEETLDFEFREAPLPGKQVAEIHDLTFHYPKGPVLIRGLSFAIGRNDRIAVIGKNGKGKSTLLQLLAGELSPSSGRVNLNQNAQLGYFGQTNIGRLNPNLTVEEEISQANPKLHRTATRNICGTMMFSGDDALKKVSVLSGGERSRVLLGKIIAEPTNLLLLDEPTNHLDMESIEALIESLKSYDGAVVIVTHSELILRELATKLIIFQGEHPKMFLHDYEYFLRKEGWGDDAQITQTRTKESKKSKIPPAAVEQGKTKKRSLTTLERKVKETEDKICALEAELKNTEKLMAEALEKKEHDKFKPLSERLSQLHDTLEEKFSEFEQISIEYEAAKS